MTDGLTARVLAVSPVVPQRLALHTLTGRDRTWDGSKELGSDQTGIFPTGPTGP